MYRKVADGDGHLSDHYDLGQVYYRKDLPVRRVRLSHKTKPRHAMFGAPMPAPISTGDVKIGDLPIYRDTIIAAISKYPQKRAQTLVTVLSQEFSLLVKWKA